MKQPHIAEGKCSPKIAVMGQAGTFADTVLKDTSELRPFALFGPKGVRIREVSPYINTVVVRDFLLCLATDSKSLCCGGGQREGAC